MATDSEESFRARVVLLGASNLTRGISTVVESARLALGSPLEFFIALGHGRSFGTRSTVLFLRSLPAILDSGMWSALEKSIQRDPSRPTFGLITDIGNDIVYGRMPQTVAGWVGEGIDRLQSRGACVGMTLLPIESVLATKPWQFAIVKSLLFPTRKLTYEDAMARARELQQRLIDVAAAREVTTIELPGDWYGFDPIHIQRRHWNAAWSSIVRRCARCDGNAELPRRSLARWARLRWARPEQWQIGQANLGSRQPAARLPDGSRLWLY